MPLLHAYFDESGVHDGAPVTLIAGFVGDTAAWNGIEKDWQGLLDDIGVRAFHYVDCRHQAGDFQLVETWKSEYLINGLAKLLAGSGLQVASAGFRGDWDSAISARPGWGKRFPSCYHMVFEMCVEQMQRFSSEHWGDEDIAMTFARHNQYAERANEIWRTFKGNGLWNRLVKFSYGDQTSFYQLQAADMIGYETFQCLQSDDPNVWEQWPLVSRLLERERNLLGGFHTEDTFIEMMRHSEENGRKYLKRVT